DCGAGDAGGGDGGGWRRGAAARAPRAGPARSPRPEGRARADPPPHRSRGARMSYKPKRGTVELEDAEIMDHQAFAGQQFILRVRAPNAARRATPGTFAHISVDPAVPLRRPLSIMR